MDKIIAVIRELIDASAHILPNARARLHQTLDEIGEAAGDVETAADDAAAGTDAPDTEPGPTAESATAPPNAGVTESASDANPSTSTDQPAK